MSCIRLEDHIEDDRSDPDSPLHFARRGQLPEAPPQRKQDPFDPYINEAAIKEWHRHVHLNR